MIKIYIDKLLPGVNHVPLLIPDLGPVDFGNELFRAGAFKNFSEPIIKVVKKIEETDFILLPHNYQQVKNDSVFLRSYIDLSKKTDKPLVIFAYGDVDEKIDIPNSIIFKCSMYGNSRRSNEIKMPMYAEDLRGNKEVIPRKKGAVPVVGFCGWAEYKTKWDEIKTLIKNGLVNCKKVLQGNPKLEVYKKGLYFRKKIINQLKCSSTIKTNFIIRGSHSANKKTIGMSPAAARDEYINNIVNSDLSLAVKGDANESMRFYEILSLGRVPILIDTDCVLPLEEKINYNDFILRINYTDVDRADQIIADFYNGLSNDVFAAMQMRAREVFELYLSPAAFLRTTFSDISNLKKYLI